MDLKHILIFGLALLLFSCESNDVEFNETQEFQQKEVVTNASRTNTITHTERLERRMEWLSFLIAHAIFNDSDAESEFVAAFYSTGNMTNVIPLESLLGEGQENSAFRNAFEMSYNEYRYTPLCFCPGGSLHPDCTIDCSGSTCEGFCKYLEIILEENCFEIYLPNQYMMPASDHYVRSTAHPVNTDDFNDCYVRGHRDVSLVEVNSGNFKDFTNLIVVRPYRDSVDHCSYELIDVEDFTLFLSN